jgi:uncharacterized protein with HEPN domain
MNYKRTYLDYLHDILDAIDKATQFTEGMDQAQFCADERTNFAVIRALEIIGEAAKKIPSDVQARHPVIPWRNYSGYGASVGRGVGGEAPNPPKPASPLEPPAWFRRRAE